MKIALLSDLHANLPRCLPEHARAQGRTICLLGDPGGYGADPGPCSTA